MFSPKRDHPLVLLCLRLIALVLLSALAFTVGAAVVVGCGGVECCLMTYPFTPSQTSAGQLSKVQVLHAHGTAPLVSLSCSALKGKDCLWGEGGRNRIVRLEERRGRQSKES